ncbi:MAG: sulfotransferase [Gemmatimonadales bacterium]|jgi:hypothetical protein
MPPRTPRADQLTPIFVLGVLERSGTNFLSDLLTLHPDCAPAAPLHEDFLHFEADLLEKYARRTATKWPARWSPSETGAEDLLAALGEGLLRYMHATAEDSSRRLVAKTPSVKNLDLLPRLFPGAPAIVLMRDGRSVVESGVRSFGYGYEEQTRKWAWAARVIRDTVGTTPGEGQPDTRPYFLVRYRDLVMDPEPQLRRIFEFTGLDADRYDYAAIERLPVRGSSTFRPKTGDLNWEPVAQSESFNPLERWRSWTRSRHARFNWLGGAELEAFGYEVVGPRAGPAYVLRNRLADVKWKLWPARRGPRPVDPDSPTPEPSSP